MSHPPLEKGISPGLALAVRLNAEIPALLALDEDARRELRAILSGATTTTSNIRHPFRWAKDLPPIGKDWLGRTLTEPGYGGFPTYKLWYDELCAALGEGRALAEGPCLPGPELALPRRSALLSVRTAQRLGILSKFTFDTHSASGIPALSPSLLPAQYPHSAVEAADYEVHLNEMAVFLATPKPNLTGELEESLILLNHYNRLLEDSLRKPPGLSAEELKRADDHPLQMAVFRKDAAATFEGIVAGEIRTLRSHAHIEGVLIARDARSRVVETLTWGSFANTPGRAFSILDDAEQHDGVELRFGRGKRALHAVLLPHPERSSWQERASRPTLTANQIAEQSRKKKRESRAAARTTEKERELIQRALERGGLDQHQIEILQVFSDIDDIANVRLARSLLAEHLKKST